MYQPLLFHSKYLVFAFGVVFLIVGFLLASNRSRFFLACGVVSVAWQVNLFIRPLGAVLTFGYLAFLALFVYSFFDAKSRQQIIPFRWPRVLWPWLGLLLFAGLAVIKAIEPNGARSPLVLFGFDLIMFFAVLRTVRTASDVRFFVGCLMVAIIVQSFVGLLQYKFPYFQIGVFDQSLSYMWWRAKGTFFHANHFGMFLMLVLPIVVRSIISAIAEKNRLWTIYGFVTVGLGAVALMASANRGSWVGLTFGLLIMLGVDFIRRGVKIRRIIFNLLALAFVCGGLLSIKYAPRIYGRLFQEDASEQIEGRNMQTEEAIILIKQNPLIGVGYNNDRFYASELFVHNVYVLIAAETGVIGLLFFIWFLLEVLREIWTVSRCSILYCANYARGALASLLGFCLASWVGPDFWINYGVQSYFWLVVALLFAVGRLKRVVLFRQEQMILSQRQHPLVATSA